MATQPLQPAEAPANTSVRRKRRLVIANDNGKPTPPAAPAIGLATVLARMSRRRLEQLAEAIISHLDALDGDVDMEDDDPAGDDLDSKGEIEDWRPEGIVLPKPLYGLDQSLGPINEREAHNAWLEGQRRAS